MTSHEAILHDSVHQLTEYLIERSKIYAAASKKYNDNPNYNVYCELINNLISMSSKTAEIDRLIRDMIRRHEKEEKE